MLFLNRKKNDILFRNTPSYQDKKISHDEAKNLIEKLAALMEDESLYKDANLKLSSVAKNLNILPHRLSQLLNDNIGKSFPAYVNEYRIKAAKKMILTHPHFGLEAIGYECGFNSKSTFYAAFKKYVGTTPAQYQKRQIQ